MWLKVLLMSRSVFKSFWSHVLLFILPGCQYQAQQKVILEVFLVCCVCNFQTVKNVDDLSGARGCILILHPINPLNCFCHECLKRRMPLEGRVTVQKHSNLDARQKAFCWTAAVCSLWERWRPVTETRDLQSLLLDLNHWLGCLSEYLAS